MRQALYLGTYIPIFGHKRNVPNAPPVRFQQLTRHPGYSPAEIVPKKPEKCL